MGLFKKLTDPGPSGGDNDADKDPQKLGAARVDQVRSLMADHRAVVQTDGADGRIVDSTALIMGGVTAAARIDAIRRAVKQINLQDTFDVQLTVFPEDGPEFTAHIVQPVVEEHVGVAVAGQKLKVKFDPEDHELVWIDWAGSAVL
ncbi:MAG: hypothetical protein JHC98_01955 [Thermoleophilaceae bacterium]|nr:hypothetical protein [Thermoleophilaceae bacterium]